MGDVIPYKSTKHAIGAAAKLGQRLGYPRTGSTVTCPTCSGELLNCRRCSGEGTIPAPPLERDPNDEPERYPIAVRATLRTQGIDPDGDDAQLLYDWATLSDGLTEHELLDLANELPDCDERRNLLARAAQAARVVELVEIIDPALREHELTPSHAPIKLMRVAWRVMEHDGKREVFTVTDPGKRDDTLIWSPEEAQAIAKGWREGPVVKVEHVGIPLDAKHRELALELVPRWRDGDFEDLGELDRAIGLGLGVSVRYARKIRAGWGIEGSRGRRPTVPESGDRTKLSEASG